MKTLYAFYEGLLVGTLSNTEDLVYSFNYEDSWRENATAFPLSLAMPLSEKTHGNRVTLSFFENLLPEDERKPLGSKRRGRQNRTAAIPES